MLAIVGAGLGLGALLIYIDRKKAAAAPPQDPCAGLSGDAKTACEAAQLAWGLVQQLPNPFNTGADNLKRQNAATAKNKQLNGGAIKTPNNQGSFVAGLMGDAIEYVNGCQPFHSGVWGENQQGATGWKKCAPGTIDMWQASFDTSGCDSHNGYSCDDSAARAPVTCAPAFLEPQLPEVVNAARKDQWLATSTGTGSIDPNDPDPTTHGPYFAKGWGPTEADGTKVGYTGVPPGVLRWYVKGVVVDCPPGMCPKLGTEGDGKYFLGAEYGCQVKPGATVDTNTGQVAITGGTSGIPFPHVPGTSGYGRTPP